MFKCGRLREQSHSGIRWRRQFPETNAGAPWAICITPDPPKQALYTSDSVTGRIYKMDLDGNILGAFGKSGKLLGQFGWVHEISCPTENTLFVGELLNWRVQKLSSCIRRSRAAAMTLAIDSNRGAAKSMASNSFHIRCEYS